MKYTFTGGNFGGVLKAVSNCLLFHNSKAVIMAMPFAVPIPWNLVNSSTDSFANSFRLLLAEINIFLDKETALSFLLPEPIRNGY